MPINPAFLQILQGALSGASEEVARAVKDKFRAAQKGSLKMVMIFMDPEGKVMHFRLGASKEETCHMCKATNREIKGAGK
jgi:hypothetical protein